ARRRGHRPPRHADRARDLRLYQWQCDARDHRAELTLICRAGLGGGALGPAVAAARKVTGMNETNFSPREIVSELDRHIVGQQDAKRAVAVALRNRWRRQQLSPDLRREVTPKNILMIGPTGVGKTEISRRLARLAQAPFVQV